MKLSKILIPILMITSLQASSLLKVECDRSGEEIYLDGKFKTECDSGEIVKLLVSPGRHTLKAIKKNKDGSYYEYVKKFRIGDGIEKTIEVSSDLQYTENYYYKKALNSADDVKTYLEKFPNGKYIKNIKKLFWSKTFGGKYDDWASSIVQTKDSGYIVVGSTTRNKTDGRDVWVLKLDKYGNKMWDKTFGRKDNDYGQSIIKTKDNKYVILGYTRSGINRYKSLIIKLDKNGKKIWEKFLDSYTLGYYSIKLKSIIQTKDGGYICVGGAGNQTSAGFNASLVLKLDKNGKKVWDKVYFYKNFFLIANSVIPLEDGGCIVVGSTYTIFGDRDEDIWILKLDKNGNKVWSKTLGGSKDDWAYSIIQTKDDGYMIIGSTESFGNGKEDIWVIKLDKNGNKMWDKTFGGKYDDWASSIVQTRDGGYIVAGVTKFFGAGRDVWVLKLDKYGNKMWDKTFGEDKDDIAYSIIQTKNGWYVVVGYTESFGSGGKDAWILKFSK